MSHDDSTRMYDTVIIGSGFGGAAAARVLIDAGEQVLMVERGDWVERGPANWDPAVAMDLGPFYSTETPYVVRGRGREERIGAFHCVGGPSVFYGGVALRFREADFEALDEIAGESGARWPLRYSDLEPYYSRAEALLDVAGEPGRDPTEPPRSAPYPQPPGELARTSRRLEQAALSLGLHPFRLPLAINYRVEEGRRRCVACMTCDGFACAISAKNDIATRVLPELMGQGLRLATRTVAVRLVTRGDVVESAECVDTRTGERRSYRARRFLVAAGALATPHLLLASRLEERNPAGAHIGRYLMRHCNAMVFGVFPLPPNPGLQFHKQIGIHDFYFGHPAGRGPSGKLGCIQQVVTPQASLVRAHLPAPFGHLLGPAVRHTTGLLAIAEDQPRFENHVTLDWRRLDRYGRPELGIRHRYTARDLAARRALVREAKRILRRAGAWLFHTHAIRTFSHAVGTVRMGSEPATAPLDATCRFRGIENLFVVDGSVMPTSAAVNPSLTIAANAMRAAALMVRSKPSARSAARPAGAR